MKRKRIDLLAPPFKGHLHPVLAMARKIDPKTYEVNILSSSTAKSEIEAAGLKPILLASIDDKALFECVNPLYPVRNSPLKLFSQFKQVILFFKILRSELELIYKETQPDLIIADFTLPIAGIIAKQNNIAWWTSMPSPCVIECNDGPPSYMGGWKRGTNLITKTRNWIGRKLVKMFKGVVFYLCKKDIRSLGLENIYREDGTEAIYSNDRILCLGYREFEFSMLWPTAAKFLGPMLYSPELSHDAPVFEQNKQYTLVTLGTHLAWCKEMLYREIENLGKLFPNMTFHFTEGNSDLNDCTDSQNQCFKFSYVNYEKYLPKYDYVIHHGGAGILYYCIKYAKPSIVIPQDYDQFDHASRLETLGLAIWVKNIKDLSLSLERLVSNTDIKANVLDFYNRSFENYKHISLQKLIDHKLQSEL